MMKRLCQTAIVLAAAGGVMAMGMPEADAARKSSLAESRLILDKNDVYLFPQLGVEYANLVSLEYGFADDSGSGLLLLGDESMAFGVGIYRGDLLASPNYFPHNLGNPNLGNVSGPIPGFPQPHTVVDLFGAFDVGGGAAGARLSFGNGGFRDVNIQDDATGQSQTFLGFNAGYSMFGDFRVDTGLNLQYGSGTAYVEDEEDVDAGYFHAGVNFRGFMNMGADVDLGLLGDVHFQHWSQTDFDPDDDDITSANNELGIFAGAGPAYNIGETTIATYGVLGYFRAGEDPDVDEDDNRTFVTAAIVPGVHLAADVQLFEWLYFRTGMQYSFGIAGLVSEVDTEGIDDAERDDITESDRFSDFGWRAGLGVEIDNFTFDGVFQSGFITGGPDFLGGTGGGMFTMVSAGYQF